jgi:hypothetical protein
MHSPSQVIRKTYCGQTAGWAGRVKYIYYNNLLLQVEETESRKKVRTKVMHRTGKTLEAKTKHVLLLAKVLLGLVNELLWKYLEKQLTSLFTVL